MSAKKTRKPSVVIACGQQGIGKSIETIRTLYEAVRGILERGIPPTRCLIVDINDEFGNFEYIDGKWHSIPPISVSRIPDFCRSKIIEIRRIRPLNDDGTIMTEPELIKMAMTVLKTFFNGILLLDDVNKILSDTLPNDFTGALSVVRHSSYDLYVHFQMIKKAGNPNIFGLSRYIRLHKTRDSVSEHSDKFGEFTEIVRIAEIIIDFHYRKGMKPDGKDEDLYYHLWIDKDRGKILPGNYDLKEAKSAIELYLSQNSNTVKAMERSLDRHGKKMYASYEAAYSAKEKTMLDDYFDF